MSSIAASTSAMAATSSGRSPAGTRGRCRASASRPCRPRSTLPPRGSASSSAPTTAPRTAGAPTFRGRSSLPTAAVPTSRRASSGRRSRSGTAAATTPGLGAERHGDGTHERAGRALHLERGSRGRRTRTAAPPRAPCSRRPVRRSWRTSISRCSSGQASTPARRRERPSSAAVSPPMISRPSPVPMPGLNFAGARYLRDVEEVRAGPPRADAVARREGTRPRAGRPRRAALLGPRPAGTCRRLRPSSTVSVSMRVPQCVYIETASPQ